MKLSLNFTCLKKNKKKKKNNKNNNIRYIYSPPPKKKKEEEDLNEIQLKIERKTEVKKKEKEKASAENRDNNNNKTLRYPVRQKTSQMLNYDVTSYTMTWFRRQAIVRPDGDNDEDGRVSLLHQFRRIFRMFSRFCCGPSAAILTEWDEVPKLTYRADERSVLWRIESSYGNRTSCSAMLTSLHPGYEYVPILYEYDSTKLLYKAVSPSARRHLNIEEDMITYYRRPIGRDSDPNPFSYNSGGPDYSVSYLISAL